MKYLFLDIEWNQQRDSAEAFARILSMGSIEFDESTQERRDFYRVIKPRDLEQIPEQTLHFLHFSRAVVEQAASMQVVLGKWKKRYAQYDQLVVWNRKIYQLFQQVMAQCGITMPERTDVIIMQELLSQTTGLGERVGFEKALAQYQIAYHKNLMHIAKHDVKYLEQLFWAYRKQADLD